MTYHQSAFLTAVTSRLQDGADPDWWLASIGVVTGRQCPLVRWQRGQGGCLASAALAFHHRWSRTIPRSSKRSRAEVAAKANLTTRNGWH
jgi:hypothetical protein